MKAQWNGKILAQSNETIEIEGNQYFPPESINKEYFISSKHSTVCPWKGTASYYTIVVEGTENKDAAWFYQNPSEKAKSIKDYVAFWKGVEVTE